MRSIFNLIAILLTSPLWGGIRLTGRIGENDNLFATFGQLLSLVPGRTGIFLRRGYYLMTVEKCEDDFAIEFLSWLAHRRSRIGHNVYVGANCILGSVLIGDNVLIGSAVNILSGRHQHNFDDPTQPLSDQGGLFVQTSIGDNSWIGNSSTVMAEIGSHTVIGAGSVVVKPVPTFVIAAGNPIRVIRNRARPDEQPDVKLS